MDKKKEYLWRGIFFIVVLMFLWSCFEPEYLDDTFNPLRSGGNGLGLAFMIVSACAAIYSFYKFFK